MPRSIRLALFVTILLSVLGVVHWYLWLRLVAQPELPAGARTSLTAAFLVLFASIPATVILSRAAAPSIRRFVAFPGYTWLGLVVILFFLVAGADLLRLLGAIVQHVVADVAPVDPERRTAVARLLAATIAVTATAAGVWALFSGLGRVALKDVRVKLARFPRSLDGMTLVQLSDIHVGPTIGRDFIDELVRRVNALAPDLVVITGDLVDGSVPDLKDHVASLADLRSRFGTFFVTGNHEYYSGAEAWCQELTRLGIHVLRNERASIGDARGSFDLAGVDDHESRRFGGGSNLTRALAGRDPSRELVLLAHQPRAVFEAEKHDVGLQLSGHTHGGQIWPWNYFVYLQQPVVAGLARFGRTLVYVSRGTGYWGPPMRLGAPSEITRVTIESGGAFSE